MSESDLDYATVTGRFALTVGDTDDAGDNPDIDYCNAGTVEFTPLVTFTKVAGGTPAPFEAGNSVIVAQISGDNYVDPTGSGCDGPGYLTRNDKPFVVLVDLTSDKVNPRIEDGKATHSVAFKNVKANGTNVTFPTRTVRVSTLGPDGDGVNDLVQLLPIVTGSSTPITVGQRGVGVEAAEVSDAGELLLTLDDSTELNAGPLPGTAEAYEAAEVASTAATTATDKAAEADASATTASTGATAAAAAADTAAAAAELADLARAQAQEVVATTDGLMTAVDDDPESDFRAQQDARVLQKPTEDLGDWALLRRDTSDVSKGVAWSTPETVIARALGWVIVTDYETPQDAVDAAAALGRTKVYFPAGTYTLAAALVVESNLWLQGAGKDVTFIACGTTIPSGGSGVGHRLIDSTSKTGWQASHLTFDMSAMTTFTSGVRCIHAYASSNYKVRHCHFKTPGAAVASIASSFYSITACTAEIVATDGTAKHDGIFDQWDGCHDFEVRATIYGNGIGKYGVLVTGESTAGAASACYNFSVYAKVYDVTQVGILANGRKGVNHTFDIDGVVDGSDLHGFGVADSTDFTLRGIAKNCGANCLRVWSETATGGITGGRKGTIVGFIADNANLLGSGSSVDGAAIAVIDNSDGIVVVGEQVSGSTHTYAVAFGLSTTNCGHAPGSSAKGTLGRYYNSPSGGSYTPTLTGVANVASVTGGAAVWTRDGDLVTVRGRMTITPTAGGTTPTQVGISLPIPSDLAAASTDLFGTAATQFGQVAAISADTAADRAQLQFPAPGTAGYIFYYSFTYKVL